MGRLRWAQGPKESACTSTAALTDNQSSSAGITAEQRLAQQLEQWRFHPDLCLVWAAFCSSSSPTLAEGLRAAKTQRRASEILDVLSGVGVVEQVAEESPKPSGTETSTCRPTSPQRSLPPEKVEDRVLLLSSGNLRADFVPAPEKLKQASQPRRSRASQSDPRNTNLSFFRRSVKVEMQLWLPGEFTVVGRLAKCVYGEVKYLDGPDGTAAAAKVVPNSLVDQSRDQVSNEYQTWFTPEASVLLEDVWNEIAVLSYLKNVFEQSPHIIRLVGIFQDSLSTYLVTEYCDGGDLFQKVAHGPALSEMEKRRHTAELLQAVRHLHRHNVGHRDISLENVLIRRGTCVLMDFGQAVRLRAMDGTVLRYFFEAGKTMYRAPEVYVPRISPVQVTCPREARGGEVVQVSYDRNRCEVLLPAGAVPGEPCLAEPHGYAAAPADVFSCGVCVFVLATGKPPWTTATDADATFSYIRRQGVPTLLRQWRGSSTHRPPSDEELLLALMLRVDPVKRAKVDECLNHPWLATVVAGKAKKP